jgi:hypothetical protein
MIHRRYSFQTDIVGERISVVIITVILTVLATIGCEYFMGMFDLCR